MSLDTIQFYTPMESAKSTLQLVNPSVGDSKRALDEYDSDIFCGGKNIISVHNTCEDTRVQLKDETMKDFVHMEFALYCLSFLKHLELLIKHQLSTPCSNNMHGELPGSYQRTPTIKSYAPRVENVKQKVNIFYMKYMVFFNI